MSGILRRWYDPAGNLVKTCSPTQYDPASDSGTAEQAFRYTYDAAGRMTALNRTADREGCGKGSVSVKYAYDRNGNNIKTLLPTGAQILREYDAADRLISERHVDKSGGIDNTTRFTYDKAGNLVTITDNQGRSTQIGYDLMNRYDAEGLRHEMEGNTVIQACLGGWCPLSSEVMKWWQRRA